MTGLPVHNFAHLPGPDDPMEVETSTYDYSKEELIGTVTMLLSELEAASVYIPDESKRNRLENMFAELRYDGFVEPLLSSSEM